MSRMGHHGNVKGVRGWRHSRRYAGTFEDREIPLPGALQERTAEVAVLSASIDDTAGRQRIEGQARAVGRREVSVDVDYYIGRVGDIHADAGVNSGGHEDRKSTTSELQSL